MQPLFESSLSRLFSAVAVQLLLWLQRTHVCPLLQLLGCCIVLLRYSCTELAAGNEGVNRNSEQETGDVRFEKARCAQLAGDLLNTEQPHQL